MKSKSLIVVILLLAGFSTFILSFPKTMLAIVGPTENTLGLCTDNNDNDGDFLVDLSDPDCASFFMTPTPTPTPTGLEDTLGLCSDGIDNDGDFQTDASDSDCAPFYVVVTPTPTPTPLFTEDTLALCTDGIDNNGNFLVDLSDPSCAPFAVVPTPTPTDVIPQNGGGSPRIDPTPTPTPSVATGGITILPIQVPTGEVLGAAIEPQLPASCTPYITTYLKFGAKKNNVTDVKNLQLFLNDKLGLKLSVTGYFGAKTLAGVKTLQSTYSDAILKPWITQGVVVKIDPTGYVFKTTKWFINSQKCPTLGLAVPNLK